MAKIRSIIIKKKISILFIFSGEIDISNISSILFIHLSFSDFKFKFQNSYQSRGAAGVVGRHQASRMPGGCGGAERIWG